MRKRHTTKYAGIRYRLLDDDRPDGPRRYIIGYSDANGEYHTETLPAGHTLEDARLRKAELERKKRTHVPTNITVGELLDDYLETRSASLAPKTYEVYAWGVTVVKDYMGNRKLKSLTTNDCAGLIRSLQSEGKKTWTIKKILTPLVGALRVAVREGWITSNPLDALLSHERPKADQKEMRCLSPDEIPRLLEAALTVRWKTLFATLLFTGMRIGEALELRWEDVYTDHLEVKRSKTKAGEREIIIIRSLRALLTAWKLQQGPGHQFVFTNASGAPVGRREALRALNAAEKRAGLTDYTLHELRHTFASMLIAQKETPMLVAAQMGHKDPSVTLKTYTHLFDAQKNVEEARERLQAAVGEVV